MNSLNLKHKLLFGHLSFHVLVFLEQKRHERVKVSFDQVYVCADYFLEKSN